MNSNKAKDTQMAENSDKEPKKLSLSGKGTLSLKGATPGGPAARQNVAMGRSHKPVAVEVKKKRGAQAENARAAAEEAFQDLHLTNAEREAITRALQQAQHAPRESSATQYQTKVVMKGQPAEAAEPAATALPESASPADKAREQ